MWRICLIGGAALLCGVAVYAQKVTEKPADVSDTVKAALKSYAEAFNKNDAQAAAALWATKAVYVDRATGERSQGREAIQADLATLFKEHRGVRLTATLAGVRFIKPDVAMADGVATVFRPGEDPTETAFSVVLVKEGDNWLIDSVQETDTPTPPTATDALKGLEFLVGHWRDKSDGVRVDTAVRWSSKRSFLIRSYSVERDGEVHEGTQVIGWDPRAKRIRSWTFDSDGSFGEESWSNVDGEWIIKMTRTLADGGTSSATQVLTRKDDNTLTVQAIAREIDGQPAPAGEPVTVERVSETPAEKLGVDAEEKPETAPAKAPVKAPAASPRSSSPRTGAKP
jgi:uncharacterized protein (TIGR02246 family)